MSAVSSSFALDSRSPPSAFRIPRKPPPVIDISERYPSPDPADPFAPLSVLRKRTTSSLNSTRIQSPLALNGSEETLNNPTGHSRSESCLSSPRTYAHYYDQNEVTLLVSSGDNFSIASRPGSSNGPNAKPGAKIGHYTPHSRLNSVGTLQAFPRIPTPQTAQAHIDLGSPESKKRRASTANHDPSDTSGSESEGDIIFSSSRGAAAMASSVPHFHLQQPTNPLPEQDAPVSPSPDTASSHNRLGKIFLSRRINSLINHTRSRATSSPLAKVSSGKKSSANGFRQVSKSSISAPQPLQPTANSNPKNSFSRRPSSTLMMMPSTDLKLDDGQRTSHFLGPVIGKSISLDAEHEMSLANHRQKHTRRPFPVPSLFSIRKSNCVLGEDIDDHHPISEQDAADTGSKGLDIRKPRRRPVLRSLTNPLPSAAKQKLKDEGGIKARKRHRMWSSPSLTLSTVQPSMRSLSSDSIVDISLSSPSFVSNPSMYAKPRRAPHPPGTVTSEQPRTTPKGDPRHNYNPSECCSSEFSDLETGATPSLSAFPAPPAPVPPAPTSTPVPPAKEWALPTVQQLAHAAYLPVTCEDGSQVSFGSLFDKTRTIVVFIRHFWCPLCQDYMSSLKSIVKPEMLSAWPEGDENGGDLKSRLVSFVVIGNGAPGMIHKYRQIFGLPFKVYTDPSLAIYQALGMGRDGRRGQHQHRASSVDLSTGCNCKSYVKHGLVGGLAMVVGRAIKVGMPVWENGGDVDQLGGEFIFGPGLKCSYAHRMQTPKGHAPIEDVLSAAGIDVNATPKPRHADVRYGAQSSDLSSDDIVIAIQPSESCVIQARPRTSSLRASKQFDRGNDASSRRHTKSFSTGMFVGMPMSKEEEDRWMEEREQSVERLRERKNRRRGLIGRPSTAEPYRPPVLGIFKPVKEEEPQSELEEDPKAGESYWESMESDVDDSGDLADAEESTDVPTSRSASRQAWAAWRKSFKSTGESASLYSVPSTVDVPVRISVRRGTYFLTDTEEEA
ncbi:hypothetical protein CVT26_002007 [Gymnopilus dilepis]|uniref:Thioredoxin domain-containing protein n=1 Tax=Gymnopilus dilepis TaxID=231916 RepID=A0A409VD71_9AGAR|nr:hypothetical protein CVT26_002007 [Gymnopilus dilepis]